ncbi:cytochrome c biogenesis protein DipZ [Methylocella silvestris]|uniref:Cytochrome C biogenesis protein n=1 Tax=Methylocella silvestris TaxID=199596 RepID=A0A2J7TEU4_METSI|nr:cytochrome c biogenesis protein DipZ [Methylocella silvestris]PNG25277.1 cytochrome C biogenesis protein [Methylocella silvestris]
MTLLIAAYLAGVLTILSPCILPVLPFVFARAGQPFLRSALPMLFGMAAAFTGLATLAAAGGGWAVATNQYARFAALALFVLFALTLLSEGLAEWINRPLVALGERLSSLRFAADRPAAPYASVLLGVATGFLWAPCAGPVLGLILTGAALNGASIGTSFLLFAYACGAATSLALALFAGAKVGALLKHTLAAGAWLRRGLGVAVLAAVALIATGLDVELLSQIDFANTTSIEKRLLNRARAHDVFTPRAAPTADPASLGAGGFGHSSWRSTPALGAEAMLTNVAFLQPEAPAADLGVTKAAAHATSALPVEGALPGFAGAVEWLNSQPLTPQALRGKVVLVNFWTFNCINCLHALPHVRAWAQKYRDHGLVVIGVHTPELSFEKDPANVRKAVARLGIDYPVAVDTTYAIWKAFGNEYWPASYFADAQGRIRHHHFGEEDYENSERVIQQLLEEAGNRNVPGGLVTAASLR